MNGDEGRRGRGVVRRDVSDGRIDAPTEEWDSVAFFIPCSQTTHVILPLSSLFSLPRRVRPSLALSFISYLNFGSTDSSETRD